MPILHAIVLGIVQGLTEFLPVSSSGHLVVVPWLFGWEELADNPELSQAFDVALHMGTFVGAVAYFWRDIWSFIVRPERRRMGLLLLLATVPAGAVGLVVKDTVADGREWLVGVMLIVFGLVLAWADRLPERRAAEAPGGFSVRDALVMGVAQAAALQPGVSRSGATISAGRWLGFSRESAARVSFLMSIPVIGGAGFVKGVDVVNAGGIPPELVPPFLWGMAAAGITGAAAVWGLLRVLRTRTLRPFVAYRLAAGVAIIALAALS